ncbi:MAG: phenylalanine--tRNA ligase subunit beta [Planctomycetota bacterium]
MKTTYEWIKELVPDWEGSVETMCERFTMSGSEVEGFERLGEEDAVIELQITSNRVDCNGIAGLARDFAAVVGQRYAHPDCRIEKGGPPVEDACEVELVESKGCNRYTALVIEGVVVGPSPDWLVQRLEALGLRPINNVVDVTNYVLFELNQPFHAFDLDRLAGHKIVVRRAEPGEKILAINGKEYELEPRMTVIADAERPVAIAGVMGGADSEVTEKTTRLLLETASFDRVSTRRTSRTLALHSDSSYRFERGVDDHALEAAARRCARLIVEVAGGTVREGIIDRGAPLERDRAIAFRWPQVRRVTGIDVPWDRCLEIFRSLGCEVKGGGDPTATVKVIAPTWRPDLAREIDLVEEIIRIHGLEALPEETTMTVVGVRENDRDRIRRRIKERLVGAGFSETLTTPFVDEALAGLCLFAERDPIVISNAMRKDENALRQSLLPSLLRVRKTNQDHGNDDVRVFEITVVYVVRVEGGIPEHIPILAGLLDGTFAEARGALEAVASGIGAGALDFSPLDAAGARLLDEEGGATVRLGDELLGYLGRPRDAVAAPFKLENRPWYFEIRLDRLAPRASLVPRFRPFSHYPPMKRDLAMIVDEGVTWGCIETLVRGLSLPNLESLAFFDEYRGKQIGAGKKSLAFSLTYRSDERTLTGEEVDGWQRRCIDTLERELGAQIRDR